MYKKGRRAHARAAAAADRSDGEDAQLEDQQTLEMQVISFFESKKLQLDANSISPSHTLLHYGRKFKPAIIIRSANRKQIFFFLHLHQYG